MNLIPQGEDELERSQIVMALIYHVLCLGLSALNGPSH